MTDAGEGIEVGRGAARAQGEPRCPTLATFGAGPDQAFSGGRTDAHHLAPIGRGCGAGLDAALRRQVGAGSKRAQGQLEGLAGLWAHAQPRADGLSRGDGDRQGDDRQQTLHHGICAHAHAALKHDAPAGGHGWPDWSNRRQR